MYYIMKSILKSFLMNKGKHLVVSILLASTMYSLSAQYNFLDSTYATNGLFKQSVLNLYSHMYGAAIDTSGSIYLGGLYNIYPDHDWGIIKLTPEGKIDSTFSGDGQLVEHFSVKEDAVTAMIVQPDGKLIAGGYINSFTAYGMARYRPDGTRDSTFGTNGTTTLLGFGADGPSAFQLDTNGNIYVSTPTSNSDVVVSRYKTNGKIDSTFNQVGYRIISIPAHHFLAKVFLEPSGKLMVYGFQINTVFPIEEDFVSVRLKNNGSIDSTYGSNGWAITDIAQIESLNSIALQPDGKYLFGGYTIKSDTVYRAVVLRYLANGMLDSTFGTNGLVQDNHAPSYVGFKTQVLLRSDGKIIMMNVCGHGVFSQRFDSNGILDTTYANQGTIHAPIFRTINDCFGFILPDNRVLFASWGLYTGVTEGYEAARFKAEPTYKSNNVNTGLDAEIEPTSNILVYPNPSSSVVNFYVSSNLVGGQLNIYNIIGELVQSVKLQTENFILDTENLPNGVYITEISLKEITQRVKWVKN
jgi:uncharacterized delta-60 repeat protein